MKINFPNCCVDTDMIVAFEVIKQNTEIILQGGHSITVKENIETVKEIIRWDLRLQPGALEPGTWQPRSPEPGSLEPEAWRRSLGLEPRD